MTTNNNETPYLPDRQGAYKCWPASGQLRYSSVKQLVKDHPSAETIINVWLDRDTKSKQKKSTYKIRDTVLALKYLIFSTPEEYTRCVIANKFSDQWRAAIKRPFRVSADIELTALLAVKEQLRRDTYYRRVKKYVSGTKRKRPLEGVQYMAAYDALINGEVDFTPRKVEREVVGAMSRESSGKALVRDWDKEREIFEALGDPDAEVAPIYCNVKCPKVHRLHPSLESAGWSYPRRRNGGATEYSEHADPKMVGQDVETDNDEKAWWIDQLIEGGADIFEIHSQLNLKCSYRELEKNYMQIIGRLVTPLDSQGEEGMRHLAP